MSLDIATARGQVSLADEQHVADWFNAKPGFRYIQTPKDRPAKVDAILTRNGEVMGLAETKCRYNLTLEQFQRMFQNEWLITAEKVESGAKLASGFCVPLYGFLFLVDADVLLVQNLSAAKMRKEVTETQRTINGGTAMRENYFVQMDTAKIYHDIKTDW
jgi:hypothetical protein